MQFINMRNLVRCVIKTCCKQPIRSGMDAIHKIVSRKLTDRSQKWHSKRLVAEENCKDSGDIANEEWNVHMSNFNPNFDMPSCDVRCNMDSCGSDSLNVDESMASPSRDSASGDEHPRKLSTGELSGTDVSKYGRERPLQKVSSAMRMKFSLSNPFSNSQKNVAPSCNAGIEETSNCDKERGSSARSDAKKAAKEKLRRKKIDITDVRILGRRLGNENRRLLIDDLDDD
uniref:Uncharacterized protein n=2 Tax=Parascaris univalens TaxID=6257 RepID=A0A915A8N6_PARUN